MDDIEWFNGEFGPYGFELGETVYDPFTFSPQRVVLFNHPNGRTVVTDLRFTPELANDLHGWGVPHDHFVTEFRDLFRVKLFQYLTNEDLLWVVLRLKDFKPKKELTRFKL